MYPLNPADDAAAVVFDEVRVAGRPMREHEDRCGSDGLWSNVVPENSRTLVTADARMNRYSTGEGDPDTDRGERTNLFDALVSSAGYARFMNS